MVLPALKDPPWCIVPNNTLKRYRKPWLLLQRDNIQCMDIVSAVCQSLPVLIVLVDVGLRRDEPRVPVGINNAGGRRTNKVRNIVTAVEVGY